MCGRFTLSTSNDDISALFDGLTIPALTPRYNIAPTQQVFCIRTHSLNLEPCQLRWGLVPSWAKDLKMGSKMLNARSETASSKPSFRSAFKKRRCLVLADGFYEWKKVGSKKQPYWIQVNESLFAMAGLWETWKDPSADGAIVETCTVLTTQANDAMSDLHDRMPVILDPEDHEMWLDSNFHEVEPLQKLMSPYANEAISMFPVSTMVNKPINDSPECIQPLRTNRELF